MLLFVTADDLKRDLGLITLKIVKGDRIRTDDLFNVTEAL